MKSLIVSGINIKNSIRIICCGFFVFFVLLNYIFFIHSFFESKDLDARFVADYFLDIKYKTDYIDIFGLVQRLLGKRQIEQFTIYKSPYDKLFATQAELTPEEIDAKIDEVEIIWNHLAKENIPYIYLEPPVQIMDQNDLPYGAKDFSHKNADYLHDKLKDINTLNLKKTLDLKKHEIFYRTDHHWSGDASFDSYLSIINTLDEMKILPSKNITTKDSFNRIAVDHFLGSYGVKVGRYYIGEEQYIYYCPRKDSIFTFKALSSDGELIAEHYGTWKDSLMDSSIIDDPNYKNKYLAALWSNTAENIIVNHGLETGKILVISHSYGWPIAQYLSLNFREVHQIDPQVGRFEGDYLSYIDAYQPDVVIFLIECDGEIIGQYRTTGQ